MEKQEPRYYIESKQNAIAIPDLRTAFEVIKLLKINVKGMGLKNKDDAIGVIIKELDKGPHKLPPTPPASVPESTAGIKRAIQEDRDHRQKLISKFDKVQMLFNELPRNYQKDMNKIFTDIEEGFKFRKNELSKNSECTILIVGETAAGKSSLINLLMGVDDLMPTSQLGCTTTICELRTNNQNKKLAVAFFRKSMMGDPSRARTVSFDLSNDQGRQQFQRAVTDSDEDGNSPYSKIEVTWPFPMLEEGIVIVDTPGIGGSKMAKYTEQYLSKSYGFIYVINSANAGGVQKGRLQNFLRLVLNAASEEGYNSESTMFVCNRWDMVPQTDREAVKQDTYDKLSRFFPDIRRGQIHYMSLTEAQRALSYATKTDDYTKLMNMTGQLLPDSLRSRLNVHYRWLTAVLKRIIYILKVSKVTQAKSMDQIKEQFQQIKLQIERLEQNSKHSIGYLKQNIITESETVTKKAMEALRSRELEDKLFSWGVDDLPGDDKKKAATDALERIAYKVATVMNYWERQSNIVTGMKERIIRVCKRDFELMENQIAKIEGALLDGDSRIVKDLHKSLRTPAPVKNVWSKARGMDEETGAFRGLGGAIAGVATIKATDKSIKKLFSDYKLRDTVNGIAKMQQATKLVLESILQNKHFQERVHKFFSRFAKDIDAVAKLIPDFLKADLELMDILKNDLRNTESNLRELFPKLLQDSHLYLGQCDIFFVNYIMKFDYDYKKEVILDPQTGPVGSGSFADVFIADLRTSRKGVTPVALKVCRDPLKENTVSDILLEDRTMRELDHPNVVKYYGAAFRWRGGHQRDMQWIMIMEICKWTLKQKFIHPDVSNPGKLSSSSQGHREASLMMAGYAVQLCSGVKYLHDKGFVHRDLKLENILVTETNVVKLTDVGLTKQTTEIANSIVGSPVYMAPEILLQSQNYDNKADIYSLGIMLWEMWYGRDAADFIQQQLFGPLEQAVKNGLRPNLRMSTKPPADWTDLIEKSWSYDPDERPSIDFHVRFFEDFVQQGRRK